MDIGKRVRTAREARGITQEELARRAGVPLNRVGRIETGAVTDPHFSTLSRIADGLGASVAELLEEPVPLAEAPGRGLDFAEILEANHLPEDLTLEDLGELRKALAKEISKPREEWRGQPVTLYLLAGLDIAMRGGKKVDELEVLEQNLKQVQELVGAAS